MIYPEEINTLYWLLKSHWKQGSPEIEAMISLHRRLELLEAAEKSREQSIAQRESEPSTSEAVCRCSMPQGRHHLPHCPMYKAEAGSEQTSSDLSAPTPGTVEKQGPSHYANPALIPLQSVLTEVTLALCKSMQFTEPEWEVNYPDSLTLQLTLRWPTLSGSTKDGGLGPVSRD